MKLFGLLLCLIAISCDRAGDGPVPLIEAKQPVASPVQSNDSHEIIVGNFALQLRFQEGRCMLLTRPKDERSTKGEREFDLNMTDPCHFIRRPNKTSEVLYYRYQTGGNQRYVLLVTGGTPNPNVTDEFQPKGCGTYLAKIRVFGNRVEIGSSGENGPPACPSHGMDEVFFAA